MLFMRLFLINLKTVKIKQVKLQFIAFVNIILFFIPTQQSKQHL